MEAGYQNAKGLARWLGGSKGAPFRDIFAQHEPMVLATCRRALKHRRDAENASQRTFVVFLRRAHRFRAGADLGRWLRGIAIRVCQNLRREQRRWHARAAKAKVREVLQPDTEAEFHELLELVQAEVGRLPEKYRGPVVLCCLEQKRKAEAAAELGLKEGTLSCWLARGREMLRRALRRRGIHPPWERAAPEK